MRAAVCQDFGKALVVRDHHWRRLIRPGGTAVVVSMPSNEDAPCTLNAHALTGGRSVVGNLLGSTRLAVDVPRLVELCCQGRLKLDELITGRYSLDRINEAIESMERGEAVRDVILFRNRCPG